MKIATVYAKNRDKPQYEALNDVAETTLQSARGFAARTPEPDRSVAPI